MEKWICLRLLIRSLFSLLLTIRRLIDFVSSRLSSLLPHLPSPIFHLSSLIPHPPSLFFHLASRVSHLASWSLISHLASLISHLSPLIAHLASLISHLPISHLPSLISHLSPRISHLAFLISHHSAGVSHVSLVSLLVSQATEPPPGGVEVGLS